MKQEIIYNFFQSMIVMFFAWFIGYNYFAITMVHFSVSIQVEDFNFIFYWPAIFSLISALTSVPLTIKIYNKSIFKKTTILFPIATLLISQIALFLLILPFTNFQPFQIGLFYFVYAGIIGLMFGLMYWWFQVKLFVTNANHIKKRYSFYAHL